MILTSVDGKVIGELEDGILTKRVKGSIHRLRTPPAWAIDKLAYEKCAGHCHTIVIIDMEANLRYYVGFKTFDDKKMYLNRGYGEQYCLPLKYWQVTSVAQMALI